MPHVKIGYPHKGKDGSSRQPGDIVWVGPQEARDIIAGGKGKEVKLSPAEIVELQRAADKAAAEKEKAAKFVVRGEHGPELPAKSAVKPKAPAKPEKPADG